jgi:hypothetical protein
MDILLFKDYYMFRIGFNYFENSNQSADKMNEISIVIRRYCYCDKIYLLQDGKLISAGTPGQVLTPSNIERAFNITVEVIPNNITNSLYVIPVLEPLHDTLH